MNLLYRFKEEMYTNVYTFKPPPFSGNFLLWVPYFIDFYFIDFKRDIFFLNITDFYYFY